MEPRAESSRQSSPAAAALREASLYPSERAFLALQPRSGSELTVKEMQTLADLYALLDLHHRPLDPQDVDPESIPPSVDWNIATANGFHVVSCETIRFSNLTDSFEARYLYEIGKHEHIYERVCWFLLRNKSLPAIYRPLIFLMMSHTHKPAPQWLRMAFDTCREWATEMSSGRRKDRGYKCFTRVLIDRFHELSSEKMNATFPEKWQVRLERLYELFMSKKEAIEIGRMPIQNLSPSCKSKSLGLALTQLTNLTN